MNSSGGAFHIKDIQGLVRWALPSVSFLVGTKPDITTSQNKEHTLGKKVNCDCAAVLGGDFSSYTKATEAGTWQIGLSTKGDTWEKIRKSQQPDCPVISLEVSGDNSSYSCMFQPSLL